MRARPLQQSGPLKPCRALQQPAQLPYRELCAPCFYRQAEASIVERPRLTTKSICSELERPLATLREHSRRPGLPSGLRTHHTTSGIIPYGQFLVNMGLNTGAGSCETGVFLRFSADFCAHIWVKWVVFGGFRGVLVRLRCG